MSTFKHFMPLNNFNSSIFFKLILMNICLNLAVSILLSACSLTNKGLNTFDYASMQNISYSSNKKNSIFTSNDSKGRQMILTSINGRQEVIDTDEFIKFSPVINNAGIFAYAKSDYSTAQSKIYLNNTLLKVTDDERLYDNLCINERYLVFSCSDFFDNHNIIFIFDLFSGQINNKHINSAFIQKLCLIENNKVLVELYDINSFSREVLLMDIENLEIVNITSAQCADSLIYRVDTDGGYIIASISGENDLRHLFNAFHILNSASKNSDFSYANNYMGRITWSESYRLCAMTKFWSITNDTCVKDQIHDTAKRIILRMNANNQEVLSTNPNFGWASTKYSYDKKTPISLLVGDSMIHYSLLFAVRNKAITETGLRKIIINNAQKYFEYQEQFFDIQESLYRIPHGIQYKLDGVIAPFNWQSAFGLTLIELYNLTGRAEYKNRARQIAEAFHEEMVHTSDNRLLWHYWPATYYDGWTASSGISKNTPEKAASTDDLYEDYSHAGLNLRFIAEYSKYIDSFIFSNYEFLLNNTLNSMIRDNGTFALYMNSYSGEQFAFRHLPKFGWSALKNERLDNYFINLLPYVYPEFDSLSLAVAYIERVGKISPDEVIEVDFLHFDKQNQLAYKNSISFSMSNYNDFFTNYQQ